MSEDIKPISPKEAKSGANIPNFVVKAINQFLQEGKRRITQNEIIAAAMLLGPAELTRDDFFSKGWLNFETLYRSEGWKVIYDKPAHFETYEAFFVFSES